MVADTQKEADLDGWRARKKIAHLVRGDLIPVPSVEKAQAWLADNPTPSRGRRQTLSTPDRVKADLDAVAAHYGANELMLVNIMPDHAARRRSYELVAGAFGLAQMAEAA